MGPTGIIFSFLESDTDTEGTKISQVSEPESCSSSSTVESSSIPTRLYGFVSSIKGHFSKMLGDRGPEKVLETDNSNRLWDELCIPVPNNPYMSPYRATDEALKKFPPTKILVCF